jgi:polyhydroxybutyrate depolymerase
VDDIGFLLGVIEDIHSRFNIDKSKIYMVGFSNGGMLTYLFASRYTEILAAAAPLAASIGSKRSGMDSIWMTPKPKKILPLIVFHARDDQNVPYEGGFSPKKKEEREYLSVSESVNFWIDNNQCNAIPSIETLHSEQVIKKTWTGPAEKNKVILYTIEEWGHRWPGHYYTDELTEADPFKEFDAAEIIWNFFKQYTR